MLLGAAVVISVPILPVKVVTWGMMGATTVIVFVLLSYKARE